MGAYEYKILEDYAEIYVINKKKDRFIIKVDLFNLEKVINYKYQWYVAQTSRQRKYVCAHTYLGTFQGCPKYGTQYLHRLLLGIEDKVHVDHINHDTLDNRISNLRTTNTSENNKNREYINSNNKTGYRNVCLIDNKYVVQLQINGKNKVFGRFDDVESANTMAEKMREKYYK